MRFGLREVIFVLLLLGMPLGAYYFVFQPRNAHNTEARKEVNAKKEQLQALEQVTQSIPDMRKEIDDLLTFIKRVEQQLPAQREVDVILREVWELADKHQLKPEAVRPDKVVPHAQYIELPINVSLVGNFDGFYEFMLDLEQLPRITRMPTMTLKKLQGHEAKDHGDGAMRADVVLSIFFEGAGAAASADRPERRL